MFLHHLAVLDHLMVLMDLEAQAVPLNLRHPEDQLNLLVLRILAGLLDLDLQVTLVVLVVQGNQMVLLVLVVLDSLVGLKCPGCLDFLCHLVVLMDPTVLTAQYFLELQFHRIALVYHLHQQDQGGQVVPQILQDQQIPVVL